MPTKHNFEMDANLLLDVIQRQAGTLGKAIYEGAMNSIDARASQCLVGLAADKLVIEDDGRGFQTEQEILTYWKRFGVKQTEEEQGRKSFGRYRMGRGQLLSFGHNTWRSGQFRMVADIEKQGLNFDLAKLRETRKGCRIEIKLYRKLSGTELFDVEQELRRLVRWIDITGTAVYFNGEKISQHPAEAAGHWQHETERFWLRLTAGAKGVDVFHLGGYIKTFSSYDYGCSGELVSKVPMQVNFARNDIMAGQCAVWQEARKLISKAAGQAVKKKSLDDSGRQRMADLLTTGELDRAEVWSVKVFTDVANRHWSLQQLDRAIRNAHDNVTVAPRGDRIGDKVHAAKVAFVLADETLNRFNVKDLTGLVQLLVKTMRRLDTASTYAVRWKLRDFAELSNGYDTACDLLPEQSWKPAEHVAVAIAQSHHRHLYEALEVPPRKILIGKADQADGWTDGKTYIAINRQWLADIDLGTVQGVCLLAQLLLHEYCHDEADQDTHVHSLEFYQQYHDAYEAVASFTHEAIGRLPQTAATLNRRLNRRQTWVQDQLKNAIEAVDKLETVGNHHAKSSHLNHS